MEEYAISVCGTLTKNKNNNNISTREKHMGILIEKHKKRNIYLLGKPTDIINLFRLAIGSLFYSKKSYLFFYLEWA